MDQMINLYKFDLETEHEVDPGHSVNDEDIPFVAWMPGVQLKVLASNPEANFFVVRILFDPGIQLPPHMHAGAVHAFTHKGKWTYLEYKDGTESGPGSYLYEPPGSVHTLKVSDDNDDVTDVTFMIEGAMIHLNEDGSVMAIGDAASHITDYAAACRDQGLPTPRIIVGGKTSVKQI